MANSPGMGRIVGNALGPKNFAFRAFRQNGVPLPASETKYGAWPQISSGSHTCEFNGSDPAITNDTGSQSTIVALRVYYEAIGNNVFLTVPHGNVILNDNDTIVYTNIQVSFSTADLPA